MKFLFLALSQLFLSHFAHAKVLDFNFDILKKCSQTEFKYEKIFLMDGRSPGQRLTQSPSATAMISSQKLIPAHYRPVTMAYSIPLFKNYIHYRHYVNHVNEFSIALVEDTSSSGEFPEFKDYPLTLILFVSDPKSQSFGVVLGAHPARMNGKALETFNFNCLPSEGS